MNNQQLTVNPKKTLWGKAIALIAVINLALVLFNLSYLPFRDVYLHYTPFVVHLYDPVKDIEPHPDTETYLDTVRQLKRQLSQAGLQSPSTQQLLNSLQAQSIALVEENPFLSANKLGTFAKLKRRMQYRLPTRSAREAFTQFWSEEYLNRVQPTTALAFFEDKIEPLLKTNYYRAIDENGLYIDNFWRIDILFVIFFALEYLGRTFWVARKRDDLSWWDAMLRYWYDALMLIPTWRWLRILPVTVRIHKSGLFALEKILAQITHEPTAYISHRASMFLITQLLNQSQEALDNDAIAKILSQSSPGITVGEEDKINLIIDRLIGLTIYKVLPEVQPDVEALFRHSLRGALRESDIYQTFKSIPGLSSLPKEATEQLADYLAQATYDVLINSYTDTEGKIIFARLSDNFASTLRQQLKDKATQTEIQTLLADLLEEWKLNYIKGSHQSNPEETLAEAEKIRERVNQNNHTQDL
ncbi:MAG: hypothetical protein QNJ41_29465 [Xenococcaceae cyanobacterium MO_188.B32]|nr:hypothetical protein [Xenococcaceae cyanobacterium MO_188.B32]